MYLEVESVNFCMLGVTIVSTGGRDLVGHISKCGREVVLWFSMLTLLISRYNWVV